MRSNALRQVLRGTGVVVSMGFALCVSASSRDRPEAASDPEGGAVAPPTSPEKRGVLEGGTKSPLAPVAVSVGSAPYVSPSSRDRPEAASDPEGRAVAPPTSPENRGGLLRGTKSPLAP